jgi:hypothetical protein
LLRHRLLKVAAYFGGLVDHASSFPDADALFFAEQCSGFSKARRPSQDRILNPLMRFLPSLFSPKTRLLARSQSIICLAGVVCHDRLGKPPFAATPTVLFHSRQLEALLFNRKLTALFQ